MGTKSLRQRGYKLRGRRREVSRSTDSRGKPNTQSDLRKGNQRCQRVHIHCRTLLYLPSLSQLPLYNYLGTRHIKKSARLSVSGSIATNTARPTKKKICCAMPAGVGGLLRETKWLAEYKYR